MCDLRTSINSHPKLQFGCSTTERKKKKNLLTDTRIAVGVFFQLLNSAVVSVWAKLQGTFPYKRLMVKAMQI
jgi:hypothetical protein